MGQKIDGIDVNGVVVTGLLKILRLVRLDDDSVELSCTGS